MTVAQQTMEVPKAAPQTDVMMAAPGQEGMPFGVEGEHMMADKDTDIELDKQLLCFGTCLPCCLNTALYTEWPQCIGLSNECQFLCLSCGGVCCKPIGGSKEKCCVMANSKVECVKKCVFIEGISQCCCLASSCACPHTQKVPAVCSLLPCCTLCVDCKPKVSCCKTMGFLFPHLSEKNKEAEAVTA